MVENQNRTDDYDSPWKEGVEIYFKELMEFFFPAIASEIDWNKGYRFLDKEFQSIVRNAEIGRRYADKLVSVWSLPGEKFHVMIHIEIQSDKDIDFPRRMYTTTGYLIRVTCLLQALQFWRMRMLPGSRIVLDMSNGVAK